MRIGTNHGSLSDRIMSYYGDSPRGMVSPFASYSVTHLLCIEVFALDILSILLRNDWTGGICF